MEIYPDPLRKGGKQAMITAQLVCTICGSDLSAPRCQGIIDIVTGLAYCSAKHYEQRQKR
jgi:hypothetical protein